MAGGLPHPVLLSSLVGDALGLSPQFVEHYKHVFYMWLAMIFLFAVGFYLRGKIKEGVPGRLQNAFEAVIALLEDFTVSNLGEEGRRFFPMLCGIFLFILTMNYMGLVPGFDAPTANLNTTLAMALFVFVFYHVLGLLRWGPGYIKHFMGPLPVMAPFMLPLELLSHSVRLLSLSLRLFGNIRGEEIVLILFFLMAPILGTLPMYFLFLLAKTLQAFIFFMLAMVYIKGSLEHAH